MPGTRISDIQHSLSGADNVTARSIIQGTQFNTAIHLTQSGSVLDTTGWTMTANAEYYKADVTEAVAGDSISVAISNPTLDMTTASRTLTITAVDAAMGQWSIHIPSDLYTGDIPADATTDVPMVAICITMTATGSDPVIRRFRHLIVIRRGW